MLELINEARNAAGVPTLSLGDNRGPQIHAEAALASCFGAHWGLDGLKPYMRYSLAGGYQANRENSWSYNFCPAYVQPTTPEQFVRLAMDGFMDSPDHRQNILDPAHRKVSIGFAWGPRYASVYQHFEGDYVEFDRLPSIKNGVLSLAGSVKGGVWFRWPENLRVGVFYDPPPRELSRGQLVRTYCYTYGPRVVMLRWPLPGGQQWPNDQATIEEPGCPDPYASPRLPPASSFEEALSLHAEARDAYYESIYSPPSVTYPWITAKRWEVTVDTFDVEANLTEVLTRHGPGVYSVVVWWSDGATGDFLTLAEYSIFYRVDPPETYGGSA